MAKDRPKGQKKSFKTIFFIKFLLCWIMYKQKFHSIPLNPTFEMRNSNWHKNTKLSLKNYKLGNTVIIRDLNKPKMMWGFISGSSQLLLLPQLPSNILLTSKVVNIHRTRYLFCTALCYKPKNVLRNVSIYFVLNWENDKK